VPFSDRQKLLGLRADVAREGGDEELVDTLDASAKQINKQIKQTTILTKQKKTKIKFYALNNEYKMKYKYDKLKKT
jgi:hypothetical protein